MSNLTTSFRLTASQIVSHICGDLINVLESFQRGGRKFLLIVFGPAPVLSRLTTTNNAFEVKVTEMLME